MSKITLAAATLLMACTASYADNCDEIRGQIDAKIKSSGAVNYSVLVVDSAASAAGKLVGSCARGSKKIMYTQLASTDKPAAATAVAVKVATSGAVGSATAAPPGSKAKLPVQTVPDKILTECKDGSVSVGGSCKK